MVYVRVKSKSWSWDNVCRPVRFDCVREQISGIIPDFLQHRKCPYALKPPSVWNWRSLEASRIIKVSWITSKSLVSIIKVLSSFVKMAKPTAPPSVQQTTNQALMVECTDISPSSQKAYGSPLGSFQKAFCTGTTRSSLGTKSWSEETKVEIYSWKFKKRNWEASWNRGTERFI